MDHSSGMLLSFLVLFLALVLYSLYMQRAATSRQAKNVGAIQESIGRQREALQLQKESNDLLRKILGALKAKDEA